MTTIAKLLKGRLKPTPSEDISKISSDSKGKSDLSFSEVGLGIEAIGHNSLEVVYFKRRGSNVEDCILVPFGTASHHVDATLITRKVSPYTPQGEVE